MRKVLKGIGTALLFLVVAICLVPTVVPPFLDRIYYEGPPSDHFDGEPVRALDCGEAGEIRLRFGRADAGDVLAQLFR